MEAVAGVEKQAQQSFQAAVSFVAERFLEPNEKEACIGLTPEKRTKMAEFFLIYGYRSFSSEGNNLSILLNGDTEEMIRNRHTPFSDPFSKEWAKKLFSAEDYQDLLSKTGRILAKLRDAASKEPSFEEQVAGSLRDGAERYRETLSEGKAQGWNEYVRAESAIESIIKTEVRENLEALMKDLELEPKEQEALKHIVYRARVAYRVEDAVPPEQKFLQILPYHF